MNGPLVQKIGNYHENEEISQYHSSKEIEFIQTMKLIEAKIECVLSKAWYWYTPNNNYIVMICNYCYYMYIILFYSMEEHHFILQLRLEMLPLFNYCSRKEPTFQPRMM